VCNKLLFALGVVLILAGVAGIAYPRLWEHRQQVVGHKEIRQLLKATPAACRSDAAPGPGVLRIPSLQVVAPVEQGTSDAILAVSVGHDPSTPWPGAAGISILEAHDVGYFASNQNLKPGDLITYTTGCTTYDFTVVTHFILRPGDTIPSPGATGLVLDSCWPPNALWFTPDRLIVTARLTATVSGTKASVPTAPSATAPAFASSVPTPPNLFDEGWLAGTLTLTGTPSPGFRNGPGPLAWEAQGLGAMAALRIGSSAHASWLGALAPGLQVPASVDAPYVSGTPVNVSEQVSGDVVDSVTVSADLGGQVVSVTSASRNGVTVVTSVSG
jgi:sortase A